MSLQKTTPNLALVIVPRHAERAREISSELAQAGVETVLKKDAPKRLNPVESSTQPCLVANTTGELRAWFYLADAVVIGKSLTGKGGQNPVEPVMVGRPTIVGPNMQNFAGVMQDLVAAGGIVQLPTGEPELLEPAIADVLSAPEAAAEMAKRGQVAMESHRGAAARTVDVILS